MGSSILGIHIIWPSELSSIKYIWIKRKIFRDFPGLPWWLRGRESACNAGSTRDMGSIPGRSPGGGNGNSFQYSCQENPVDRGAWWATVHGVEKRVMQLSNWRHTHIWQTCPYFHWRRRNQNEKKKARLSVLNCGISEWDFSFFQWLVTLMS